MWVPLLAGSADAEVVVGLVGDEHEFGVFLGLEEVQECGEGESGGVLLVILVLKPEVEFGDDKEGLELEGIVVEYYFG